MSFRRIVLALIALILLVLPFVFEDSYTRNLLIFAFIYAVVASNWDLTMGYGGVFNFAHLAFFGIGVYCYGILGTLLDVSPWLSLVAAGVAASAAAALVTLPVLRLKGIYVVLVTFAFSQLCLQIVLSQSDVTGGSMGMVRLPPLRIGELNFARDGKFSYYYAAFILLVLSTAFLWALMRSRFGVSVVALRDNEDYAVSRGISLARQRLLLMAASAFFTGVAGGLYAAYLRVASTEVFSFGQLSLILSMLLVGGTSSIFGPIVAAFALTFANEWMIDFGPWRFLVIAVMIVAVMRFFPGGLIAALPGGARAGRRG